MPASSPVRCFASAAALALAIVAGRVRAKTTSTPLPDCRRPPKFPEFIQPSVPAVARPTSRRPSPAQERGWQFLQAGDLRNAEREFKAGADAWRRSSIRRETAPRLPRAGAQGARRRRCRISRGRWRPTAATCRRWSAAAWRFSRSTAKPTRCLRSSPRWPSIRRSSTSSAASKCCSSAASGRTWPPRVRRRATGKLDEAARAYASAIASSPDSAFLYRELAGRRAPAGQYGRRARRLPQGAGARPDRRRLDRAASATCSPRSGDLEGAEKAYTDALLARAERRGRREARRASARSSSWRVCRPSIARSTRRRRSRGAIWPRSSASGSRRSCRPRRRRDAVVITDARNHWAATWIMAVARAGDHRSVRQPHVPAATRSCAATDLALAMSRLLVAASRRRTRRRAELGIGAAAVLRSVARPPRLSRRRRWPSPPA